MIGGIILNGYLVKSTIRHDGVRYKKGDFIDADKLDEQSAKRLLFLNAITKAVQENEEMVEVVPPEELGSEGSQGGQKEDETIGEILDLNFEPDELKTGAKEQGLEWKGNISKANLIKLIVDSDKQNYFLDQLED